MENKQRNQTSIGLNLRSHNLIKLLAKHGHRKLSQQIEFLAIEECKRQGIEIPAESQEA